MDGHTDVKFFPVIPNHLSIRSPWGFLHFRGRRFSASPHRPTPKWNLEFNADYTDWSSFGTITISRPIPTVNVQPNPSFELKWQASWMYEFGVTRYLEKQLACERRLRLQRKFRGRTPTTPRWFQIRTGISSALAPDIAAAHSTSMLPISSVTDPPRQGTGSTPSTVGQIGRPDR
jgi:hypothetical protein